LNETETKRLFKLYHSIYSTFKFSDKDNITKAQENPYGVYFVAQNLENAGMKLRGQYIDSYGKCRGLYGSFSLKDETVYCSVLCFPQQPLNLPAKSEIVPLDVRYINSSILPKDTPTRRSMSPDGITTGLWYRIEGIETAIYFPIANADNLLYEDLPYAANPLVPETQSLKFFRYLSKETKLRSYLKLFTAIYRAYAIDEKKKIAKAIRDERNTALGDIELKYEKIRRFPPVVDQWLKRLVVKPVSSWKIHPEIISEIEEMSLTSDRAIMNVFPPVINHAKKTGLIDPNGKFIVLSDKLLKDLEYYSKTFLAKQPSHFYEVSSKKIDVAQFGNIREFKSWVMERDMPPSIITDALDLKKDTKDPVYYIDANAGMFLVQNVASGVKESAIYVSHMYRETGANVGYTSTRATLDITITRSVTVYTIIGSGIATFDQESDDSLKILQIAEGKYAALLE
jgi:hypothetical protein